MPDTKRGLSAWLHGEGEELPAAPLPELCNRLIELSDVYEWTHEQQEHATTCPWCKRLRSRSSQSDALKSNPAGGFTDTSRELALYHLEANSPSETALAAGWFDLIGNLHITQLPSLPHGRVRIRLRIEGYPLAVQEDDIHWNGMPLIVTVARDLQESVRLAGLRLPLGSVEIVPY